MQSIKSNIKSIISFLFFLILVLQSPYIYATDVSGRISTNTIWAKANSPYIVTSTVQVYGDGSDAPVLTIENGVVVKFNSGTSLQIGNGASIGVLQARGTDAEKITFTSNTSQSRGAWGRIYIDDGSVDYVSEPESGTILDNCIIEYGGGSVNGYTQNESIYIYNSSPKISNCEIKQSKTNGISILGNSNPIIEGDSISFNNAIGISVEGGNPQIKSNTIVSNGSYPIKMYPTQVNGLGSDKDGERNIFFTNKDSDPNNDNAPNNNPNQIYLYGQTVSNTVIKDTGIPYYVSGDIYINASYQVILNIEPGVEMKFANNTMIFIQSFASQNKLVALGTETKPIRFTSAQANPNKGDWKGIIFAFISSTSNYTIADLAWCTIEYGGGDVAYPGNLSFYSSNRVNLKATDCTISNSARDGVWSNFGSNNISITRGSITGNNRYGVYKEVETGVFSIDGIASISNNGEYGLRIGPNDVSKLSGNNVIGNTKKGVVVVGGTLSDTGTWPQINSPYIIAGNININGSTNPKVTIEAGTNIKFGSNYGLTVTQGSLNAVGNSSNIITFTSNSNINPIPRGDWNGIIFLQNTVDNETKLDYCTIEYGGKNNGNINITSASPTITNCNIQQSSQYGIFCSDTNASPILNNNTISNNTGYSIRIGANKIDQANNNNVDNNGKKGIEILAERISKDIILNNIVKYYDVITHFPYKPISVYGDTDSVTLTVNSGVNMRFGNNTGLQIGSGLKRGGLRAIGGQDDTNKILFTANTDNLSPAKGFWGNIFLDDGSDDYNSLTGLGTILENCKIEYGAYYNNSQDFKDSNLNINNSSPKISNCTISKSRTNGVMLDGNSSPTITDSIISENSTNGIYLNNNAVSNPIITENTITLNGNYGILCENYGDPSPTIKNNTFSINVNYAIRARADQITNKINNNIISDDNVKKGIELLGTNITQNTIFEKNMTYDVIISSINIINNAILTIESGAKIRFSTTSNSNFPPTMAMNIGVNSGYGLTPGTLRAIGGDSEADKIIFTANTDNSYPPKGFWAKINIGDGTVDYNTANNSGTIFENCVFEYAGYSDADILITNSSPKISKSIIRKSKNDGIKISGSSTPIITNNTITENDAYGVNCTDTSSRPTLTNNTISNNSKYAVRVGANSLSEMYTNTFTNNTKIGFELIGEQITKDTVLIKDFKRYDVVDSRIYVYGNTTPVTLTIEPGVEMRFSNSSGLDIGYEDNSTAKRGILRAIGGTSDADKIIFTSNSDTKIRGVWRSISIYNGAVDYDITNKTGTILENCIVEYGGIGPYASIFIKYSSPKISNCLIKESIKDGIVISDVSSSPIIENNIISNNTLDGLYSSSSAKIKGNIFFNNDRYPLAIAVSGININSVETNNIFTANNINMIEIQDGSIRANVDGEEVIFKDLGIPYYVSSGLSNNNISKNVTLTIEPGVEMRFNKNRSISIDLATNNFNLKAIGTADKKIKFTSNEVSPAAGDWRGLVFYRGSYADMSYCEIEYAGWNDSYSDQYPTGSIKSNGVRLTMNNCVVKKSLYNGIVNNISNATINNCEIKENNRYGILSTANILITNSIITNNASYGLFLEANSVGKLSGNTLSGNGVNGIYVIGGRIYEGGKWEQQNSPYIIDGDVTINGHGINYPSIILEEGSELRFNGGNGLDITQGSLSAVGTSLAPIKFTSDANKGAWKGLSFGPNIKSNETKLENCIIENGGGYSRKANIYLTNSSPSIKNCSITKSKLHGIYNNSSSPLIENNFIDSNDGYGVYSYDTASNIRLLNNTISNNGGYAVRTGANNINDLYSNMYNNNTKVGFEIVSERIAKDTILKNEFQRFDIVSTADYLPISVYGTETTPVTLTIEPGIEMRFSSNTGLQIGNGKNRGILRAIGSDIDKIKFTANADSPTKGFWGNINITDYADDYDIALNTGTILENCIVEFGARTVYADENIYTNNCSPKISKTQITQSRTNGIKIYGTGTSPILSNNEITDNGNFGVYINSSSPNISDSIIAKNSAGGIYSENYSNFKVNNSYIYDNLNYGINNYNSPVKIDAKNNWWGDISGPFDGSNLDVISNTSGLGNKVSDNVDYSEWMTPLQRHRDEYCNIPRLGK